MHVDFEQLVNEIKRRETKEQLKILIIGHGRHGKDTLAKMISKEIGYSWCSSSRFVAKSIIFPIVSDIYGDWKAAYEDRANNRELWFHAIRAYNFRPGPSLTKQILEDYNVYVGMRSRIEFEQSAQLFDLVIWVDRSPSIPHEPSSSMELIADDADYHWVNTLPSQKKDLVR